MSHDLCKWPIHPVTGRIEVYYINLNVVRKRQRPRNEEINAKEIIAV